VTCLIDSNNTVVASYRYDPFGNLQAMGGWLAAANLYRFSSKEYHPNSGLVYYLYRYYDPNLQRWLNRDPIGMRGGVNLYRFVLNNPLGFADPLGLVNWCKIRSGSVQVGIGIMAAVGIAVAEAPSWGAATIAVPTVFFGITHGMMDIGAGIKDEPHQEPLNLFLERWPSNPGEAIAYPWPPLQRPAGYLWSLGSFGWGNWEAWDSLANGERLWFPLTEMGLDAAEGIGTAADCGQ